MAEIAFPSITLAQFAIEPVAESIIKHSSPFTGSSQIYSRGIMRMTGVIAWPRKNTGQHQAGISEIEAFLTRVYGGVMTFKIPVPGDQTRRLLDVDKTNMSHAALAISSVTSDLFETEFTAAKGILVGDWVNFGDRLHKVVAVTGDTTYRVTPAVADATEPMVWRNPVLNARAADSSVSLPAVGTWRGPWQLSIEEVI